MADLIVLSTTLGCANDHVGFEKLIASSSQWAYGSDMEATVS